MTEAMALESHNFQMFYYYIFVSLKAPLMLMKCYSRPVLLSNVRVCRSYNQPVLKPVLKTTFSLAHSI